MPDGTSKRAIEHVSTRAAQQYCADDNPNESGRTTQGMQSFHNI
jgi:hypothetical protein